MFRYIKRKHLIDVTEVFRFVDREKKYRIIKLAFYLFIFIIVVVRFVFDPVLTNYKQVFCLSFTMLDFLLMECHPSDSA